MENNPQSLNFDLTFLESLPPVRRFLVMSTGGTILSHAESDTAATHYTLTNYRVNDFVDQLGLDMGDDKLSLQTVCHVDSSEMTSHAWLQIMGAMDVALQSEAYKGIVIMHGTDTLEETAQWLSLLYAPKIPVIFTGAMRPASHKEADGPDNVRLAIKLLQTEKLPAGFYTLFGTTLCCAHDVVKSHTSRLSPFTPVVGEPGSFDGSKLVLPLSPAMRAAPGLLEKAYDYLSLRDLPWVECVLSGVDARSNTVELLIENGVQGLVVMGTGNGTLQKSLQKALRKADEKGIPMVLTSRTLHGEVSLPEGVGFIPQTQLSPYAARIRLMAAIIAGFPQGINPFVMI